MVLGRKFRRPVGATEGAERSMIKPDPNPEILFFSRIFRCVSTGSGRYTSYGNFPYSFDSFVCFGKISFLRSSTDKILVNKIILVLIYECRTEEINKQTNKNLRKQAENTSAG